MIARKVEVIRRDREMGSRELALETLKVLRSTSLWTRRGDFAEKVMELCLELTKARPTMVMIGNISARFYHDFSSSREPGKNVALIASKIEEEMEASLRLITGQASALVNEGSSIVTHSYSSTVVSIIKDLSWKKVRAMVTESRPLLEGKKTALSLSKHVETKLIIDAAANVFMKDADLVLVGADAILPDGSVVNKVGTSLLALSAKRHGKPFYVACETWKFSPWESVELEEGGASEVSDDTSVRALSVLFDLTQRDLITGIITEKGVLKPEEARKISKRLRSYWENLVGDN